METISKQSLRRQLLARRKQSNVSELNGLSEQIAARALGEFRQPVRSIHIYLSSLLLREVNTAPLLRLLEERHPDIEVFVPLAGSSPQAAMIQRETVFHQKMLDISEPVEPLVVEPDRTFDIIVVPTLAFDAAGNRLGYGGGYYDKLLARQPGAQKIALCLEAYRLPTIPAEAHDISLDAVVTEQAVHYF
jgi:5-formyltetrahydrofolate cyclo-ligase